MEVCNRGNICGAQVAYFHFSLLDATQNAFGASLDIIFIFIKVIEVTNCAPMSHVLAASFAGALKIYIQIVVAQTFIFSARLSLFA
jgi:hypothetical protein